MLGNFTYCNRTKLHVGEDSLNMLNGELDIVSFTAAAR